MRTGLLQRVHARVAVRYTLVRWSVDDGVHEPPPAAVAMRALQARGQRNYGPVCVGALMSAYTYGPYLARSYDVIVRTRDMRQSSSLQQIHS